MLITLKPYDDSMAYTHYENIQGMCMTRVEYYACFAGGPIVPTEANRLAALAERMIKTGFVMHREFESCFEMGNGAEVMAILVAKALKEDELRRCWKLGEYYIGDFDEIRKRVSPKGKISGQH